MRLLSSVPIAAVFLVFGYVPQADSADFGFKFCPAQIKAFSELGPEFPAVSSLRSVMISSRTDLSVAELAEVDRRALRIAVIDHSGEQIERLAVGLSLFLRMVEKSVEAAVGSLDQELTVPLANRVMSVADHSFGEIAKILQGFDRNDFLPEALQLATRELDALRANGQLASLEAAFRHQNSSRDIDRLVLWEFFETLADARTKLATELSEAQRDLLTAKTDQFEQQLRKLDKDLKRGAAAGTIRAQFLSIRELEAQLQGYLYTPAISPLVVEASELQETALELLGGWNPKGGRDDFLLAAESVFLAHALAEFRATALFVLASQHPFSQSMAQIPASKSSQPSSLVETALAEALDEVAFQTSRVDSVFPSYLQGIGLYFTPSSREGGLLAFQVLELVANPVLPDLIREQILAQLEIAEQFGVSTDLLRAQVSELVIGRARILAENPRTPSWVKEQIRQELVFIQDVSGWLNPAFQRFVGIVDQLLGHPRVP
jgi:hypothetical protein